METTKVDWKNTVSLHEAFWNWKLAASSVPWAKRTPNMPSELTEAIVCLCTGAKLISKGNGDILLKRNKIGEVKGTISSDHDLSSFSPSSKFDNLFFVHMDPNSNDIYHVYDLGIDRKGISKIKVNSRSTFGDHSKAKRRPRFSIFEQIIKPKNLIPTWKLDMKKQAINTIR